nr:uncharacterized protein CTRU02_15074 [Colletotrichum truncatum]KAF6781434.1 hypothetical protein CTRU02_15074 [Colletotrichum truncatum]
MRALRFRHYLQIKIETLTICSTTSLAPNQYSTSGAAAGHLTRVTVGRNRRFLEAKATHVLEALKKTQARRQADKVPPRVSRASVWAPYDWHTPATFTRCRDQESRRSRKLRSADRGCCLERVPCMSPEATERDDDQECYSET